jgi:hypothetical protein
VVALLACGCLLAGCLSWVCGAPALELRRLVWALCVPHSGLTSCAGVAGLCASLGACVAQFCSALCCVVCPSVCVLRATAQ